MLVGPNRGNSNREVGTRALLALKYHGYRGSLPLVLYHQVQGYGGRGESEIFKSITILIFINVYYMPGIVLDC